MRKLEHRADLNRRLAAAVSAGSLSEGVRHTCLPRTWHFSRNELPRRLSIILSDSLVGERTALVPQM
jgi:hypothetical protein